tara:strand:- start:395 stop:931 length:537 start_codon:yes stop_codon:yes gene_type:complete
MQDYIEFAEKNNVLLKDKGPCQFCNAQTERGIHECLEIFNLGFQQIDFSNPKNHIYRFFIVDAHTLQHPEIHGRWNNHFHLSRLHLILEYNFNWSYQHSPQLSNYLKKYKLQNKNEVLSPPPLLKRGEINSLMVLEKAIDEAKTKEYVIAWAKAVYLAWKDHHHTVDSIAKGFLKNNY